MSSARSGFLLALVDRDRTFDFTYQDEAGGLAIGQFYSLKDRSSVVTESGYGEEAQSNCDDGSDHGGCEGEEEDNDCLRAPGTQTPKYHVLLLE
jgi:hypothetical protein